MKDKYLVYLAGPITGNSFDDVVNWREEFCGDLPNEIVGLSPMRGKTYLEQEASIAQDSSQMELTKEVYKVMSSERGITTRDYNDVRRADLIVVNLLGAKKVSVGTVMEIAWAKAFSIPVVLVMEKSGNPHDHPMVRDSVGFRVETLKEALFITECTLLPVRHRQEIYDGS